MKPTVSVIIPTCNRRDAVVRAIASVDAQTHRVDEIIVVDDGSVDDTATVLRRLPRHAEHAPLQVITQQNRGPAAARNAALQCARGDLVAFLDDDDVWHPDKIARQWAILAGDRELALLACSSDTLGVRRSADLRAVGEWQMLVRNLFLTPCVVARREVILECGGFPEDMRCCEDYALWLRIVPKYRCALLGEQLVACGGGKPSFGHSGLSADLAALHQGELEALRRWRGAGHGSAAAHAAAWLLAWARHRRRLVLAACRR